MLGWVFDWLREAVTTKRRREDDISCGFGENPLVWSRKTESILFHRFRQWTQRMGAARTVGHHGRKLPAAMMPEQAAYMFGYDHAPKRRRRMEGTPLTRPETAKDVVFRDLASHGFVIAEACRYGGNFVIYHAHPSKCHSSDTIRVVDPDEALSCIDLAAYCRVQGSVLKRAVLASVCRDTSQTAYVSFAYNAALSTEAFKKVERRLSRIITHASVMDDPALPTVEDGTASPCHDADDKDDEFDARAEHDDFEKAIQQNAGSDDEARDGVDFGDDLEEL